MSAAAIEKLVAQGRFDHQFTLVRAHWSSVRCLWLTDSDLYPGNKIRSELPAEFWIGCGVPGIANIKLADVGRFEFAGVGNLTAAVIPVYDGLPALLGTNAARHVEELRDLVAVDLDHPDRYWRRRGEALILGNALLELAGQEDKPIAVFRNPLSWLRSGGAGVVVLDWDYARDLLLDRELIAEDLALGERLDAALKPDIWIAA